MAALAGIAQDLKLKISGSDTPEVFPTDSWLKSVRIKVKSGFLPKNLPRDCDLVIYTGAHQGANNPEVVFAKKTGIKTLNYARALAEASDGKDLIATAGVGGKSTTAGLIATVLETAGIKPSWAVGVGDLKPLGRPGRYRLRTKLMVAETDEFVADPQTDPTPKFHYLHPKVAVITNIEHDHPDVYPGLKEIYASFKTFAQQVVEGGVVIANWDNPHVREWLKTIDRPTLTYGFSPGADWQIFNPHLANEKQLFNLRYRGMEYRDLVLSLPGRFNLLNAAAAFAVGHWLGINPDRLASGLKAFIGTKRRFELIAEVGKVRLYDDYAHHPAEITALLTAAKDWLNQRRIIVIFQSHTYSRTKALLPQFVKSLSLADAVLINDIFASARETETLGISGQILSNLIRQNHRQTWYAPGKAATLARLKTVVKPGDAIITIGAGNNWLWHKDIIKVLKQL